MKNMANCCPCCEKHCPKDALNCPRGRKHFGINSSENAPRGNQPENHEEKTILLLRKCGHFLHHHADGITDTEALLKALTDDERKKLQTLLEKCLDGWQSMM